MNKPWTVTDLLNRVEAQTRMQDAVDRPAHIVARQRKGFEALAGDCIHPRADLARDMALSCMEAIEIAGDREAMKAVLRAGLERLKRMERTHG